ncbi:hypothetical protein MYK68_18815 [Gordonia sp. PP30]|uniref:hypothetical protein n=1 Tax=unclassified Gordonia (in: high G+C Gram-positive bacteria) TaxID=2657482 RepID=UPI001FFEFD2B|nr:hypothetical protein [Gordonia sp. PP30]UQE74734.1 hypothetical protein MYK68_18815 [Gordonia sp. PP30]
MSSSRSVSIPSPRRVAASVLALTVGAALLAGCDSKEPETPLTSLVVGSSSVPDGFTVVPANVEDLISANRSTLEQAASVAFTPPECAPTADAKFNPALTTDNTVLLVAQSDSATLSEVVSTVRRDIDADRRVSTGVCRVVTAVPSTGTLAGARIVTTSTELSSPTGKAVEQALVVRQDTVTTLAAGGGVRTRSSLLSNVLVRRPSGEVVTVQLNVGSSGDQVTQAQSGPISPPIPESEYTRLVQQAVDSAAR